jgi:hypothetical protein
MERAGKMIAMMSVEEFERQLEFYCNRPFGHKPPGTLVMACREYLVLMKGGLIEPTPAMVEEGAQRLVRWEGDSKWPDSWSSNDVRISRMEAERVWRSMAAEYLKK